MTRNGQPERIETLLRSQRGVQLSPQFRSGVLDAISRLPDPELLAVDRRPCFSLWLACGLLTIILGALSLSAPQFSATLAAWQWELTDLSVALSLGGTVLSASLLSILIAAAGFTVLTVVGIYGRRNHLIGA